MSKYKKICMYPKSMQTTPFNCKTCKLIPLCTSENEQLENEQHLAELGITDEGEY